MTSSLLSWAVIVTVNGWPTVAADGADTPNEASTAGSTTFAGVKAALSLPE